MEPNKQIDYGSLEWFDCENNFPPIHTDLYVYSEHGYGIGRLGRRVKDHSIIWTVHLDSGEVYLVYAFYKVKRWAYMPKDEKTNTKLKHELMLNKDRSWVPCYLKSEVDKVIAHQKYKRCLAKAERCKDKIENPVEYDEHDDWLIINEYWERWRERWLKIAEKFKEAK